MFSVTLSEEQIKLLLSCVDVHVRNNGLNSVFAVADLLVALQKANKLPDPEPQPAPAQ